MLYYNTLWTLRPKPGLPVEISHLTEKLDRDGFVLFPNFLSDSLFRKVKEEFRQLSPLFEEESLPPASNPSIVRKLFLSRIEAPSALRKAFLENPHIALMACHVSRRELWKEPQLVLGEWSCSQKMLNCSGQFTSADTIHFDVPYPSAKFFFYIDDVSDKNGAIHYAPGSHQMSWGRVLCEYKQSLFSMPNPLPSRKDVERCHLNCISLAGSGNTAIVINAKGFHYRNIFSSTVPRRLVYIDFRYLDDLGAP